MFTCETKIYSTQKKEFVVKYMYNVFVSPHCMYMYVTCYLIRIHTYMDIIDL